MTRAPFGGIDETGNRPRPRIPRAGGLLRLAGLALAAACLVALMPATAAATPGGARTFEHSAKSGELKDGRLTLRGVGRKVTWATNDGSGSGSVRIRRLHRVLFHPLLPPLTGTLHITGHRGGDEPTFSLSRPRYNASRQTVSYRAKRLRARSGSARAAGIATPRRFGASSLSMVADDDDKSCMTFLDNNTGHPLILVRVDSPNGQTWQTSPGTPNSTIIQPGNSAIYEADGPNCSYTVYWATTDLQPGVLFTASTSFAPGTLGSPFNCDVTVQGGPTNSFGCDEISHNIFGIVTWGLHAQ
jgi:hypothetical protein